MPMSTSLSALTFALCLTATTASPQQSPGNPPRDNAPTAAMGTGIVRGQVTDRETGQPLARVMVTLTSAVWREQAMSSSMMMSQTVAADDSSMRQNQPRRTMTAADGRYEFK